MSSKHNTSNTIKSDHTLFTIIELLHEDGTMGVTELADSLDLAKSTIHKHLKTLEEREYVRNDGGQYQLGFKFLTLGGHIRDTDPFCKLARTSVGELVEETNQMVSFVLRDGGYGVAVFVQNDRYGLRKQVPLGNRFPLYQNGAGKSILAELSDDEIEACVDATGLESETHNTITDIDRLWEEIKDVRTQGYATSTEERVEGVQSIAAAAESPDDGIVGSLSIAVPSDHQTEDRLHSSYVDTITEAANELELRARYGIE